LTWPRAEAYFVDHLIRRRPKYQPAAEATTNGIYKALADPTRRRILALLRERPMTAGELASQFDLSWPTMSGHFAVLREADLVQSERTGTSLTYRLNQTVLQEALMALFDAFGFDPSEPRP
jgi:ArsR family transcriptional regulator, arsenate/arsenite/antimonite-responsive transcriptional repressor